MEVVNSITIFGAFVHTLNVYSNGRRKSWSKCVDIANILALRTIANYLRPMKIGDNVD